MTRSTFSTDRLDRVSSRITSAARRRGRDPGEVRLIAATKTVPSVLIQQAFAAGLRDFAENYAEELAGKADVLEATWHFVGKLQSGTASKVARAAHFVHSAEPGRALLRLARISLQAGRVMPCLAQVDFTGKRQGVAPADLEAFIREMREAGGLRFAGLMTLPPFSADPEHARPYFAHLRDLREKLKRRWPEIEELSMGMSFDYEVAVEEGATMVRVGTALFGERPARMIG